MGKNKRQKLSSGKVPQGGTKCDNPNAINDEDSSKFRYNPLYKDQHSFLASLSDHERNFYFSSHSSDAITPERRAEIWMDQAEVGEDLVNKYAWATPTKECLQIFQHFSPIVEIGCGSNAYWANFMKKTGSIDVVAYDSNIQAGGKIPSKLKGKKRQMSNTSDNKYDSSQLTIQKGGPEVLSLPELRNHTLFLCYPDEEDAPVSDDNDGLSDSHEQGNSQPLSFGWQCLTQYKGKYVIHVGELGVLGDATLNLDQAPWGRSSSSEFQQRLASEFHCIAKIQIPNWLHVRDSISVWKRSEICQMAFVGDDGEEDEEEEEIVEYRHIPPEEMLPTRVIAPCLEHIFASSPPPPPPPQQAQKAMTHRRQEDAIDSKNEKIKRKHVSAEENSSTMETEMKNQKSSGARRRARQKQKKMQLMKRFQSNDSDGDDDSDEVRKKNKEEKKKRSEYFRLHGKLPSSQS